MSARTMAGLRRGLLRRLRAKGFDRSSYTPSSHSWRVACSQCQALVVSGTPCHERGCPNERKAEQDGQDGQEVER